MEPALLRRLKQPTCRSFSQIVWRDHRDFHVGWKEAGQHAAFADRVEYSGPVAHVVGATVDRDRDGHRLQSLLEFVEYRQVAASLTRPRAECRCGHNLLQF
jgi:hypothetical protein